MAYVKDLDEKGLLERNFDRPPLKDTVTVPVGGFRIFIFFLADNKIILIFIQRLYNNQICSRQSGNLDVSLPS